MTFHVSLWATLVASVGVIAALAANLRARLADTGASTRARWGFGLLGLLPLILVVQLLLASNRFSRLLAGPVLLDAALALAGGVLAGRALDRTVARLAGSGDRSRARGTVIGALAGGLVAQAAFIHAAALLGLDPLPTLTLPEPAIVQVGRTATLVPLLAGKYDSTAVTLAARRWAAEPVTITGEQRGEKQVRMRAAPHTVPWITATGIAKLQVVEERGDPRLPLRVGNIWRYTLGTSHDVGGLIGLFSRPSTTTSTHELRVEGTGEIAGGGVRTFRITLDAGSGQGAQVYAADGQSYYLDTEAKPHPLFSAPPEAKRKPDFALLGDACDCAEIGGLRGPSGCVQESRAGTGEKLAVGFLTLGLIAPGNSYGVWKLSETVAGPADAAAAASSDAAVDCEVPTNPREGLPPGDDSPPAVRTTWRESVAAAPPWGFGNVAPQWGDFRNLYEKASREKRPAADAELVVCNIGYSGNPDGFFGSAPDLDITLHVGEVGPIALHNPDNTHVAFMSSGPVALRGGERISAHLVDRNTLGSDEDLGVVTASVGRDLPARGKRGAASIECRGLDRDEVAAALKPLLAKADEKLERASDRLVPDAQLEGLGIERALGDARDAIMAAAALAGWADPRVARRLAWERLLVERFEAKAAPVVKTVAADARAEVSWSDFTGASVALRVEALSCDPEKKKAHAKADKAFGGGALERFGCVVVLALENRGKEAFTVLLGQTFGWLAFPPGKAMKLRALDMPGVRDPFRRREVAAGEKKKLVLVPIDSVPADAAGAIVLLHAPEAVLAVPAGG
jgi:hypothetical protein